MAQESTSLASGVVPLDLVRAHVFGILTLANLPEERVTEFLKLAENVETIQGVAKSVDEAATATRKTMSVDSAITGPLSSVITINFPTAEQLDQDAASPDAGVAALAKKLKRWEKRFDEAFSHKPPDCPELIITYNKVSLINYNIDAKDLLGFIEVWQLV